MRRWDRTGISKEHFVEYNGKPVLSVKNAFRNVVQLTTEIDAELKQRRDKGENIPVSVQHLLEIAGS
jgi:hypothetical protein